MGDCGLNSSGSFVILASHAWKEGDEKLNPLRREGKKKKKKEIILARFLLSSLLIKMSKGWVPWQLLLLAKQDLKLLQSPVGKSAGARPAPRPWENALSRVPSAWHGVRVRSTGTVRALPPAGSPGGPIPKRFLRFKQIELPGALGTVSPPPRPIPPALLLRPPSHADVDPGPAGNSRGLHLERVIA